MLERNPTRDVYWAEMERLVSGLHGSASVNLKKPATAFSLLMALFYCFLDLREARKARSQAATSRISTWQVCSGLLMRVDIDVRNLLSQGTEIDGA
jgi:hypothetical protein